MEYAEQFLVLKTGKFREYDLWLKVFSPNYGIKTYFAFGGAKSRKRFCGCLDFLNILYGKIENKKEDYFVLKEASLIESFIELKKDKKKLGATVNSLLFLDKIKISKEENKKVYFFLHDFLKSLTSSRDVSFFPLLFKSCLIFNLGYLPHLDSCLKCKRKFSLDKEIFFSFKDGGIFCSNCKQNNSFKVYSSTLNTLKKIAHSNPKEWSFWNIDLELKNTCYNLVNSFVQYHLQLSL